MYTLSEIDSIVERNIIHLPLNGEPQELYDPLKYMLSLGGKRVRPRLCLAIYSLFKDNLDANVIYPAIALEIFHSFTLIHDDIMDKADVRRNNPTLHKKRTQLWVFCFYGCTSANLIELFSYKWSVGVILSL